MPKKKKYIWNSNYTIQQSIERTQTTKCIQYNIHDTKSCELPKYLQIRLASPAKIHFITELDDQHTQMFYNTNVP